MTLEPVIVWFRQDLRLVDNPALSAAAATGRPVVPVFVLDDDTAAPWAPGAGSRWWLGESLASLQVGLQRIGSRLVLRRGGAVEMLLAIAEEAGARSIYFSRSYEPTARGIETALRDRCGLINVAVHRYGGRLLVEPEMIRTQAGEPFRVFTPFWRAFLAGTTPRAVIAGPKTLVAPRRWPESDRLEAWELAPRKPDWAGGLRASWTPGEAGAAQRLATLIDSVLQDYARDRDRPERHGTSMLSPHLHFGEISPGQCWHAVAMARDRDARLAAGAASFLREIGWREFSAHLLHHWPHIADTPFRPEFADFPWQPDRSLRARHLAAWTRGRTGYPIVDAGMRQLWQSGWMHNRVRMITASFLTKHLLVPWQDGARWFWDTLVDADLASNSASWQWGAGSGADAAPYFRIFNPVLQGEKFDGDGAYIRRYVPELKRLPPTYIHAPWTAPARVLADAGVILGTNYPFPLVDHRRAREQALAAYGSITTRSAGSGEPTAPPVKQLGGRRAPAASSS